MIPLLAVGVVVASSLAAVRWLRVAQREHYLPVVARFAWRWWTLDLPNRLLAAAAVGAAALALIAPLAALFAMGAGALGPRGLGLRGRSAPLVWTARLRRLAIAVGLLSLALAAIGLLSDLPGVIGVIPLLVPLLVDGSARILRPYERRKGTVWVDQAAAGLRRVAPTVVAITGSFGKTSTKVLTTHLLAGSRAVVASPASFNNRMGLARAVNDHLSPGTEVFVAEMGTYGPGEIRDMCAWVRPDVAVITALGPVHLERMGSVEVIAAAKREILEHAAVGVVSVDHPLLADIARNESSVRRIVTVSGAGAAAEVCVENGVVKVGGDTVATYDPEVAHAGNVAAAVGVVLALGIDPRTVAGRLSDPPPVAHRRSVVRSDLGFSIIDDTFNANPAGAVAALELLGSVASPGGRKVVVTPGMVELGSEQPEANRRFMSEAAARGVTDVVVVNRTNRRHLVEGARAASIGSVIVVDTREAAVSWVRDTLTTGDAVLYENDLPDHYP